MLTSSYQCWECHFSLPSRQSPKIKRVKYPIQINTELADTITMLTTHSCKRMQGDGNQNRKCFSTGIRLIQN